MGIMEQKAQEKFEADQARAEQIAKAIAAEKAQAEQDRKGG